MAELYIDIPVKDRSVIIIGAGHLAIALSKVFHFLSWRTTIVDRRADSATSDLFPYAKCYVDEDIKKAFSNVSLNSNSAVIITNPQDGEKLLTQLETSPAFYIGMVGSRKRDFSSFKFLHAPIGLMLGGETPEEVALSIAAEVMAVFNKKDGLMAKDFNSRLVVVRGAGDLATGTIIRLHNAGYKIIALETEKPTVIRRNVSLASAIFDGECTVEGVKGIFAKDISAALSIVDDGNIPIMIDSDGTAIRALRPRFVVDAILAKKNLGTTRDMAELVIGLGPGFTAGDDVDVVIETKRGHTLGSIIKKGSAIANSGIPGIIGGYGKERVIRAENNGVFKCKSFIGDIVKKGDIIAYVDKTPVLATLNGCLRGLLHDGLSVTTGFKIADIDPRGEEVDYKTISDKARAIAGGVLEAIDEYSSTL